MTIDTIDDSRKRPGSPGLASSTWRRRANDEISAHRMLAAITAAVAEVASVTSSVTYAVLAPDIRRSINERSRRLDWDDSKIACRYHLQVDYEFCACDILFSSLKMRECPPFIYGIMFNMYTQLVNNKNTDIGGGDQQLNSSCFLFSRRVYQEV